MENNKFLDIFRSKAFLVIICIVFSLALLCTSFSFGVIVGTHKAKFLVNWGDNYKKNFGGPRQMMDDLNGLGYMNEHGANGQIISINKNTQPQIDIIASVIIKCPDNTEKSIIINKETTIRSVRSQISVDDLKIDDSVVIVGEPNTEGQILAKLIRVMPADNYGIPMPMMPRINNYY
jgi:hypothetical protein